MFAASSIIVFFIAVSGSILNDSAGSEDLLARGNHAQFSPKQVQSVMPYHRIDLSMRKLATEDEKISVLTPTEWVGFRNRARESGGVEGNFDHELRLIGPSTSHA